MKKNTVIKAAADEIHATCEQGVKNIIDVACESLERIGFTEVKGRADIEFIGKLPDDAEPEDRSLKANYEGHFDTGNPRDEFFAEIQIAFYPWGADSARDASKLVFVGEQPGREPGFNTGTLSDVGASLLTADAALNFSSKRRTGTVCTDHYKQFQPKIFISLLRDNGEEYEFEGTISEAFIAINDTLKNATLVDAFEFVGLRDEVREDRERVVRNVPVEGADEAPSMQRPLYTDDLPQSSARAVEEDEPNFDIDELWKTRNSI